MVNLSSALPIPFTTRRVVFAVLTVFWLACLPARSQAQTGGLDPGFLVKVGLNGPVYAVAAQSDGKVLVGGNFFEVNGTAHRGLARLNADGSLDTGFGGEEGARGTVRCIAVQGDGKIIVGGDFTRINGAVRSYLARLNADGTADSAFNSRAVRVPVQSVAIQSDGRIIIGASGGVARLNADGSVAEDFTPPDNAFSGQVIYSVASQSDGKIIVGGEAVTDGGEARAALTRLNADGSLDAGFTAGGGANGAVRSLVVQADGKVTVGGEFTVVNGVARHFLARLNADGSVDASFVSAAAGANGRVQSLALQGDGKIVLGGDFTSVNGLARGRIARLNADGSVDGGFASGSGADAVVNSVAVAAGGRVVLGGEFVSVNDATRNSVARFDAVGGVDLGFSPVIGTRFQIWSVVAQGDGKILIGGTFSSVGGLSRPGIARLYADGSLDAGFAKGVGINGAVESIAVRSDGKIVIGGAFSSVGGVARPGVARLNADGSVDTGFAPGSGEGATVRAVAVQGDGKTLAAGSAFNGLTRLNEDGSVDAGFTAGSGIDGTVSAIVVQRDGKIVICGEFFTVNGVQRQNLARFDTGGSVDTGFVPSVGGEIINSVASLRDGKIIIGGSFTNVDGTARNHVARLNANGSLDAGFATGSGPDQPVYTVAVQSDGKVLIGGAFTSVNGAERGQIARLNADGSVDAGFVPDGGTSPSINFIALQPDGKVLISGDFDAVGVVARNRIARLIGDASSVPVPVVTSAATASGEAGAAFSYQITASGDPFAFGAIGLPAGLTLDPASGLITGQPTGAGTFTVTLAATNEGGTGTATLVLTVEPAGSLLPVVALTATSPSVLAGSGERGVFTLNLSEPQDHDVFVKFSIKGSAANGIDYVTLKATKKIKAGKTSKKIKVVPLGTGGGAGVKRTVVLKLLPDENYTPGSPRKAKVKIIGQ